MEITVDNRGIFADDRLLYQWSDISRIDLSHDNKYRMDIIDINGSHRTMSFDSDNGFFNGVMDFAQRNNIKLTGNATTKHNAKLNRERKIAGGIGSVLLIVTIIMLIAMFVLGLRGCYEANHTYYYVDEYGFTQEGHDY